jgi:hypothetical protein
MKEDLTSLKNIPDNALQEVLSSMREVEEEMLEEMEGMSEGSKEYEEALLQYQDLQQDIAYIEERIRALGL